MSDIIIINLTSVMITWKDLGVDIHNEYHRVCGFNKWNEIEDWLNNNLQHDFRVSTAGIWFSSPVDAVLFKLTWANQIIS